MKPNQIAAKIKYTIRDTKKNEFDVIITHFHDKVSALKRAIQKKTGIPVNCQMLISDNLPLEDSKELVGHYKLKSGSVILLVEQGMNKNNNRTPQKKSKPAKISVKVPACTFKINLDPNQQFTADQLKKEIFSRIGVKIGVRHVDWKAKGLLPRIGEHKVSVDFKGAEPASLMAGVGKQPERKAVMLGKGSKRTASIGGGRPSPQVERRAVLVGSNNEMKPRASETRAYPNKPANQDGIRFSQNWTRSPANDNKAGKGLSLQLKSDTKTGSATKQVVNPVPAANQRSPFKNAKVGGWSKPKTSGTRSSPFANAIVGNGTDKRKNNLAKKLSQGLHALTFAPSVKKNTTHQKTSSQPFGVQPQKKPSGGLNNRNMFARAHPASGGQNNRQLLGGVSRGPQGVSRGVGGVNRGFSGARTGGQVARQGKPARVNMNGPGYKRGNYGRK